jgi:ssDNA-binding Zn-finger/Zn-ribbon topoisomerase 1
MENVICPCGAPMVLRETSRYKYPNGQPRKFYGCSRYPKCKEVHGAHPDGRPLGIPATKETRALRHQCHTLVESLLMSVPGSELYMDLADLLGVAEGEVHFGAMDKEQCEMVIEWLKKKLEERNE